MSCLNTQWCHPYLGSNFDLCVSTSDPWLLGKNHKKPLNRAWNKEKHLYIDRLMHVYTFTYNIRNYLENVIMCKCISSHKQSVCTVDHLKSVCCKEAENVIPTIGEGYRDEDAVLLFWSQNDPIQRNINQYWLITHGTSNRLNVDAWSLHLSVRETERWRWTEGLRDGMWY